MKKDNRKKIRRILTLVTVAILGTASWAFYSLINETFGLILEKFGIINTILQNFIIFLFVFIILILMGSGVWKAFEKIIKD